MIPSQSWVCRQLSGLETVSFLGNQWLSWGRSMPLDSVQLYRSGCGGSSDVLFHQIVLQYVQYYIFNCHLNIMVSWAEHLPLVYHVKWGTFNSSELTLNNKPLTQKHKGIFKVQQSVWMDPLTHLSHWREPWHLQSRHQLLSSPHNLWLSSCSTETNRWNMRLKGSCTQKKHTFF